MVITWKACSACLLFVSAYFLLWLQAYPSIFSCRSGSFGSCSIKLKIFCFKRRLAVSTVVSFLSTSSHALVAFDITPKGKISLILFQLVACFEDHIDGWTLLWWDTDSESQLFLSRPYDFVITRLCTCTWHCKMCPLSLNPLNNNCE